jgi:hypothetical protein
MGDFQSVQDIIEAITSQRKWRKGGQVLRLRKMWRDAVGAYLAESTEVVGIRGEKAVVAVADGLLASELAIHKPLILEKMRGMGADVAPKDIVFKVDPSLARQEEGKTGHRQIDPSISEKVEEMVEPLGDEELRKSFKRILEYSLGRKKE